MASSSIGKKQVVAITGLFLILFLIFHLSGNFLIYKGPDAFNAYAEFLENLGAIKWMARLGLIALFLIHIVFTAMVVIDNRKARPQAYEVVKPVMKRSWATRLMPYTGSVILLYLIFHLLDYTLADHSGQNSIVNGQAMELYGLVYNSFQNPIRVAFYVIGMTAVGFHLTHAIQSVMQTFGFYHVRYTPIIKRVSLVLGIAIAVGFASIPFYMMFMQSSCVTGG